MSTATITNDLPTAQAHMVGRVKFYNSAKCFGFIATDAGWDGYFTTDGYRKVVCCGNNIARFEHGAPPPLQEGQEVLLMSALRNRRGVQVLEWSIPSLNHEEVKLYVVIEREETETRSTKTTAPVCDTVRKIWVNNSEVTVTQRVAERVVSCGTDKDLATREVEQGVGRTQLRNVTRRIQELTI